MIICIWMVVIGIVLQIISKVGKTIVNDAKQQVKDCDLFIARRCFGIVDITNKSQQKKVDDALKDLVKTTKEYVSSIIQFEKKWGSGAHWYFCNRYDNEKDGKYVWEHDDNVYEVAKKMKNPVIINEGKCGYHLLVRKYNKLEMEIITEHRNIQYSFTYHKIGKMFVKDLIKDYRVARMLYSMCEIHVSWMPRMKHGVDYQCIINDFLGYHTVDDMNDESDDFDETVIEDPNMDKWYSSMSDDIKKKHGITKDVNDVMDGKMSDYLEEYKKYYNSTSNKKLSHFVKQYNPKITVLDDCYTMDYGF